MSLWSKTQPLHEANNFAIYEPIRQCGIFNISQPYRHPLPVTGITLHFYI
jgi:hypothetical protein